MKYFTFIYFVLILSFSTSLYAFKISPIPYVEYNNAKAKLGKKLFFDPMLSQDGTVACVSCHLLPGSGADTQRYSFGVAGKQGNINSPTVLNAYFNIAQFYNGRAKNLYEQISGPIENPIEMNNSIENVLKYLRKDSSYNFSFIKNYGEVSENALYDAIAEFEKALTTMDSKFDLYLKNRAKLSKSEARGYALFKTLGCISCHNGVNIGSNMYQKIGIFGDFSKHDPYDNSGRFCVTRNEKDRYYFKVPTLRNISQTAPYFHTGHVKTLKEAIQTMAKYQLGIQLKKDEVDAIESFLKTFDGQTPKILNEQ